MKIRKINLGNQGLVIPEMGLGCMTMTTFSGQDVYGSKANEAEAIATIRRAEELGINFLDTADVYGPLLNEQLIAKATAGNRGKYIIATKFGEEVDDNGRFTLRINGSPSYMRKAVERSLKNLHTDYIDLYYLHRLDRNIPVEETVYAMGELVTEGKVRYIGLSEVSAETIRRAHKIHPLTAVQSEYSLFERSAERLGISDVLQELKVGFVAYAPLGRGFITGSIRKMDDMPKDDFRRSIPKYQGDQLERNLYLLGQIEEIAEQKNITLAQLAIAWVISRGHVPIAGTRRKHYLERNAAAAGIVLSPEDLQKLESIIPLALHTGERYNESMMLNIDMKS